MKKLLFLLVALALLTSCGERKTSLEKKISEYETVKIPAPDLSGITDNGREVLNLYRFAADEVDKIYWKQAFGDKAEMEALEDEHARKFAMLNYGPWDRSDGSAFVEGYGERPAGLRFYPEDMTEEEFRAFDDPDKNSPFTLIRRNDAGQLETVWYHDAYSENIEKICNYLTAAADITIKESVRNYLLKKAEALRTDEYYDCDLAWLDMDDSKMDLILGPDEAADDQLFGIKNSYEAFVLLKDEKATERLHKFVEFLPEFQAALPCVEEYKAFTPGAESRIYACNAIYYAGQANAGIKVIALNLPFDGRVQSDKGSKTVLLENVIEAKFNSIIAPTGYELLFEDQAGSVNKDAFFSNVSCREIAHGLGVKETINGKGSVAEALGNLSSEIEEIKANIVGVFLSYNIVDKHQNLGIATKEDVIATYLVNLIRSERFGEGTSLGRANIMIYNYLHENDAFKRTPDGKYRINYEKFYSAVSSLSGLVLEIQAAGDYEAADNFARTYGVTPKTLDADMRALRLANIPKDIVFEF